METYMFHETCIVSPKCHIVYCIVLAWFVQSNLMRLLINIYVTLPYIYKYVT